MNRENLSRQSVIDQAIVMFEQGEIPKAMRLLESNAIPGEVVDRVLYHPDLRRHYINDYLTGF